MERKRTSVSGWAVASLAAVRSALRGARWGAGIGLVLLVPTAAALFWGVGSGKELTGGVLLRNMQLGAVYVAGSAAGGALIGSFLHLRGSLWKMVGVSIAGVLLAFYVWTPILVHEIGEARLPLVGALYVLPSLLFGALIGHQIYKHGRWEARTRAELASQEFADDILD